MTIVHAHQEAAQEEEQGMTEAERERSAGRRHRLREAIAFLVVLSSLLVAATIVPFWQHLFTTKAEPLEPARGIVGRLFFAGSGGPFDPASDRGLDDVVTVNLHSLVPPTAGNRYDAWLLPDPTDVERPPLFLGTLSLSGTSAALTYTDPDHVNLLATYSRFLITEEGDLADPPLFPSLDVATWRYVGSIPTIPSPDANHLSFLDDLRHLLVQDPTLSADGLSGGLGPWLLREEGNVLAYATAARNTAAVDGEPVTLRRDQVVRILDALDGALSIQEDVPPGTPWLIEPGASRPGLLAFPPLFDEYLVGLVKAPGATADQRQLALALVRSLVRIASFLRSIRQDALLLVHMSDAQLSGGPALSLLDEMATEALYAYAGQPIAAGLVQGVAWVYQQLQQSLASFPILVVAPGQKASFQPGHRGMSLSASGPLL